MLMKREDEDAFEMYKRSKHIFFVFFKYEFISYESISKIH